MSQLLGRLGTLTAYDVMTRDVITLRDADSIESAIEQLRKNHISGAPVVDAAGKFVGILSLSDLVRDAQGDSAGAGSFLSAAGREDATTWEMLAKAAASGARTSGKSVAQRMTQNVVTVNEKTALIEACRVMCHGHWHRVPVVNDAGSLCGIISTMDVLAALVNAADEPE